MLRACCKIRFDAKPATRAPAPVIEPPEVPGIELPGPAGDEPPPGPGDGPAEFPDGMPPDEPAPPAMACGCEPVSHAANSVLATFQASMFWLFGFSMICCA